MWKFLLFLQRFLYSLQDGSLEAAIANGAPERLARMGCAEVYPDTQGGNTLQRVHLVQLPSAAAGGRIIKSQPIFRLAMFVGETLFLAPRASVEGKLLEVAAEAVRYGSGYMRMGSEVVI